MSKDNKRCDVCREVKVEVDKAYGVCECMGCWLKTHRVAAPKETEKRGING